MKIRRANRRIGALIAAASLAGMLGATAPSQAAKVVGQIISGPGNSTYPFLTARVVMTKGSTAVYRNLDIVQHNVWFTKQGFGTPNIGLLQTWSLPQVSKLKAGTYKFKCTLHPLMVGALIIR